MNLTRPRMPCSALQGPQEGPVRMDDFRFVDGMALQLASELSTGARIGGEGEANLPAAAFDDDVDLEELSVRRKKPKRAAADDLHPVLDPTTPEVANDTLGSAPRARKVPHSAETIEVPAQKYSLNIWQRRSKLSGEKLDDATDYAVANLT